MLAPTVTAMRLRNVDYTLPASQGAANTVLTNDSTGGLTWALPNGGSSSNILGGLGGQMLYQSAVNTTSMLANGTAGQVLTSAGGTFAPNWITPVSSPITINNTSNLFSTGLTGTGSGVTTATNSNFFGVDAGYSATSASNSNFMGYFAGYNSYNASNSNFLGQSAGSSTTNASNSNFLGQAAGNAATSASNSNFLGFYAGSSATNSSNSNFLGFKAGKSATNASNSIFIGQEAGNSDIVDNTSNGLSSILVGSYTNTGGFSNSILLGSGVSGTPIANTKINQFMLAPTITAMRLRNIDYSLPFTQGGANTVLTNDGTGVLSWAAGSTGGITNLTADNSLTLTPITGGYNLSVPRPELELYAKDEGELLTAWATADAYAGSSRIYITGNITFSQDRQFIRAYGSPAIKFEGITQLNFIAGSHIIDFGNIVFTNITFRTTGTYYFRLVGGIGTFNNCGWVDDVADTGTHLKNIVVVGPITNNTAKITLKGIIHFTQSPTDNAGVLIQPFTVSNEATFSGDGARLYVNILEMDAVYDYSRFSRVQLTSTTADAPYSVTGDESWFYAPAQQMPGEGNIKTTAIILKTSSVDNLYAAHLAIDESANYVMGIKDDGTAVRKLFTGGGGGLANNIAGGLGGQILYQSAVDTTAKLPNGAPGQVLTSNGTTLAPSWTTIAGGTSPIAIVDTSSLFSTGIGAGNGVTTATNSNFFGAAAGSYATAASGSNFFGNAAGYGATYASDSNFLGSSAGNGAVNAYVSNFFGQNAGNGAISASNSNFLGNAAGQYATNAHNSNLFGFQVGKSFTGNNLGSNNIIIGTNISLPNGASDAMNLGGVLFATGTYGTITGDPLTTAIASGLIGIGTNTPQGRLHLMSYQPTEDRTLVLQATNPFDNALVSNSPGVNFLDSTSVSRGALGLVGYDNAWTNSSLKGDMVLRVERGGNIHFATAIGDYAASATRLFISNGGDIGIGTSTPTANFQVFQSATGSGTVSNGAGGTTVTGVGTQFTNTFKIGDTITIGGQTVTISNIASNTSMTTGAITSANSNVSYTLSGGSRFSVLGNGNVGIGVISPTYKFQVGDSIVPSGVVARFENINGTCDVNPTAGSVVCSSDINLKKNILTLETNKEFALQTIPDLNITKTTLDKIMELTPVVYNWKSEKNSDSKHIGFIAQEMEQVFPDIVFTDYLTNKKSISYTNLIPYTIKAIQELSLKIDNLSSLDTTSATSLGSLIKNFFASEYNRLDKIFVKTVVTEGIEMKDSATGEPYCVVITNGELNKVKGKCGEPITPVQTASTTIPDIVSPIINAPSVPIITTPSVPEVVTNSPPIKSLTPDSVPNLDPVVNSPSVNSTPIVPEVLPVVSEISPTVPVADSPLN